VGYAALAAAAAAALLTPHQKAALVVASGLPAEPGVAAVLVRPWDRSLPRPRGALVLADQEGGTARGLRELPPWAAASSYSSAAAAFAAGRETGRGLRAAGVDVDLAPVLDLTDGPLGSRQFRSPSYGLAFARALGRAACVKHFPGLGPLPISTDERLHVYGTLRAADVAPFRAAIRAGVRCVMVGHGIYRNLGPRRAALEPAAYRLLRRLGFRGVAITDSFGVLGDDGPGYAPRAIRAGADVVLYTSGAQAREAIRRLLPMARRGELDLHVARVLAWRRAAGR
jgi:beta-N-acetylhexosaminidase